MSHSAPPGRSGRPCLQVLALVLLASGLPAARAADRPVTVVHGAGIRQGGVAVRPVATAVMVFDALALQEARRMASTSPRLPAFVQEPDGEDEAMEPHVEELPAGGAAMPEQPHLPTPPPRAAAASPAPSLSFAGMDGIPRIGGSSVLSPDTNGAVGLTKLMETLNNNYLIQDKATGATLSAVSIDTFWSPLGVTGLIDPKTLYDPYTDRWIVVVLSDFGAPTAAVDVGVSMTGDPSGAWSLFRFDADAADRNFADFPTVGFNMSWVAVNVNMFAIAGGAYAGSQMFILDYPQLRAGTASAVTVATAFCTSPAATYSASEPTLYAPSNLSDTSGTFRVNTITGTPSAPVYTFGPVVSRGLTWADPGGALIPQLPPLSGASACGATPCPIRAQDSNFRQTPVVRGGYLYATQTVGLPAAGLTHVGVMWTKYDLAAGTVVDGGLIEDPSATATNGGKWYDFSHVAVNRFGDLVVGFSEFSSAEYASAGYALHSRADAPGVMNAPVVFKPGEDYYHKDLGRGTNRWGDYSKAQVDPSNDTDLWVLQEYAEARTGVDDGGTATNSSKWGTWWAKIVPALPDETAPGLGGIATAMLWSGKTTLTWPVNPTATSGYALHRGLGPDLSSLVSGTVGSCVRFTGPDENATTASGLLEDPPGGAGFYWYLVDALNLYGEGPAGNATPGPRIVTSSGSCP